MKMIRIFIDSNIWVYAFLESREEKEKRHKILSLIQQIKENSILISSIQVLNEFHWVLKRKYHIEESAIREKVEMGLLKVANIVPLNLECYQRSYNIRESYKISYWDSLIVSSALKNNCEILYSEDMKHGLIVDNDLKILNPFI